MRHVLWSRVFVIVIAGSYLGFAYSTGEAQIIVSTFLFLVLPVPIVWFADDLAGATGYFAQWHRVSAPSPAFLLKTFGFVILLAPPIGMLLC